MSVVWNQYPQFSQICINNCQKLAGYNVNVF